MDSLGTTLAALADPTRRAMVQHLAQGPASVHKLSGRFPISQQMVSKHIAVLVRARVVTKRKHGRESICTLRPAAIKSVGDWAFTYREFWEQSFDRLDQVLTEIKKGKPQP